MAADISGAVTLSHLDSSADDVKTENIGVVDIDIEKQWAKGRWHVYIEGTSSTESGAVTDIFGESYADAGAAADSDGQGRFQISNFEYYYPIGEGELVIGLLYPSGFTESGDWTNDETTQFMSSSFVNIQTSGNPDYALGVGYSAPLAEGWSYNLLVSQAQGLGDLDGNYGTLFNEMDEYFVSAELVWNVDDLAIHANLWTTTLDSETFTDANSDSNSGINLSLGYDHSTGLWVVRYGTANKDVSEVEQFWGVSWQREFGNWAFGLGTSKSFVSSAYQVVENVGDLKQHEAYARFNVSDNMHVTASYQKISNSAFGLAVSEEVDPSIISIRASLEF